MPRIVPLPAEACGRALSIAELSALGISERRSYGADLQRPFRGVRSNGLDLTELTHRCAAYLPRVAPGQFFSHSTAAMLHGMPVPLSLWRDPRIHVAALRPALPPNAVGVVGHRLRAPVVRTTVAGLPASDAVTTWCLLGSTIGIRNLVAAADYLLGPKPKATASQLATAVASWHGHNGAAALRAALPLVRPRVRSPRETLLRLLLADAGLPEPQINYSIYDGHGRFLAESDLVYPEEKVVLEYEGDYHRTDAQQWRKDIARRESLEDAGWRVLRITADDLDRHPDRLLARIRKAMTRPRPRP